MKTKLRKPKKGETMITTRFIPGYPVGLSTDSRVTVRDVSREGRVMVDREDGRATGLWVDRDGLRFPVEPE